MQCCHEELSATYHELDVTTHDIKLVLHGELTVEVQKYKGYPGETHRGAGQDAAPQGTVESRLFHSCSHLFQQGVGSTGSTDGSQGPALVSTYQPLPLTGLALEMIQSTMHSWY